MTNIRNIIKRVLLEDVDVTKLPSMVDKKGGVDAALDRADFLKGEIEKNLSSLGVYNIDGYMEGQGIFSPEMIKNAGEFNFSFTVEGVGKMDGIAKYNHKFSKKQSTIVLDFINKDTSKHIYKKVPNTKGVKNMEPIRIFFEKNSLNRPFLKIPKSKNKINVSTLYGIQSDEVFIVKMTGVNPPISKPTKIRINKIGINWSGKDGGKGDSGGLFSTDRYIKVIGRIKIDQLNNVFTRILSGKITNNLLSGKYYARLSEKDNQTLVLSTSNDESGEFLVIQSDVDRINEREPNEWNGKKIVIGEKAHGSTDWSNKVSGVVIELTPIK